MKRSWGVSTGMDPHIRATCTSYEYMSPADACHVWLKAVTFTVLVRLVKSKRSASDLVPYHISAQLILLTYYSRYIGGTAVDMGIRSLQGFRIPIKQPVQWKDMERERVFSWLN